MTAHRLRHGLRANVLARFGLRKSMEVFQNGKCILTEFASHFDKLKGGREGMCWKAEAKGLLRHVQMMLKERASGMYRLSAFYFARTASDIPMEFTIPIGFLTIIYFMAGLRLTPGAYFGFVLIQLLTTFVSQSAGLLIGATVMDAKTAQMISAVVMLVLMLVGRPALRRKVFASCCCSCGCIKHERF